MNDLMPNIKKKEEEKDDNIDKLAVLEDFMKTVYNNEVSDFVILSITDNKFSVIDFCNNPFVGAAMLDMGRKYILGLKD